VSSQKNECPSQIFPTNNATLLINLLFLSNPRRYKLPRPSEAFGDRVPP